MENFWNGILCRYNINMLLPLSKLDKETKQYTRVIHIAGRTNKSLQGKKKLNEKLPKYQWWVMGI